MVQCHARGCSVSVRIRHLLISYYTLELTHPVQRFRQYSTAGVKPLLGRQFDVHMYLHVWHARGGG